MAEEWTKEDEVAWQAAQHIIRKRARIYMKKRRDKKRVRKYSRSENKSSIVRNKQAKGPEMLDTNMSKTAVSGEASRAASGGSLDNPSIHPAIKSNGDKST